MKTVTVYAVTENTDKTEGRGQESDTGIYFQSKLEAVRFVSSDRYKKFAVQGVINPKYAEHKVKLRTIALFDNVLDFDQNSEEMVKQQKIAEAKAKLSSEEIELLGL
jgi:hypothetical protein